MNVEDDNCMYLSKKMTFYQKIKNKKRWQLHVNVQRGFLYTLISISEK